MNLPKEACDAQRINDYLEERLNKSDQVQFENHLEGCANCQSELQCRAAEPEVWSDAIRFLGHADSTTTTQVGKRQHELLVAGILNALAPTDDPAMLGRIGEYEISGIVGFGGMGAVLKGFDKYLRRVVAIKVMAPHLADSGSARSRFRREARAAAAITHDNVIEIYGVSEANKLPYLVMPFARGPSLQSRIDESGPMTATEVVRIGRQIASGLAAAHEQGLVHRDIKPANILLSEGIERLWITDFGVARAIDDASMTQTGLIAGTPQFMSPEQARGESVDYRSDLFSLGSVMYTACTGHPPFRSEAAYGILRRITDTNPRPIQECNPEIPAWLCAFIERLMAKQPGDRFQSAKEVAELLEDCLAHLQQPTQVSLPPCVTTDKQAGDFIGHSHRQVPIAQQREVPGSRLSRKGIGMIGFLLTLAGLVTLAAQLTAPVNVSGQWTGEDWRNVSLASVDEASNWYSGAFTDAEGRSGAIHLEWSRLQRRYNGRWKIGNEQFGSITLRVDESNSIRGAISVDPDSQFAAEIPRLREFSWERSSGPATISSHVTQDMSAVAQNRQMIESPVKGVIITIGEGLAEGSQVEKGQLIVEIQHEDPLYLARLEEQYRTNTLAVEVARGQLDAREQKVEAMSASVQAAESMVSYHKQVILELEDAHERVEASAEKQLSAVQALRDARSALLKQALAALSRVKELRDQGTASGTQLEAAEKSVRGAEAVLAESQETLGVAEQNVIAKRSEYRLKLLKANSDLEQAEANLRKTHSELAEAKVERAKLQEELTRREKDMQEVKGRLATSVTQEIRAPRQGVISGLANLSKNMAVKEGDLICAITPAWSKDEKGRAGRVGPEAAAANPPQMEAQSDQESGGKRQQDIER